MARRALITGATGFVGGHLVERLAAEGWGLRALVRPTSDVRRLREFGVELREGDLSDAVALAGAVDGVDVVYHLAAVTFARTEAEFTVANVEGTRALAAAMASADPLPRRLVYLSSFAAVGPVPERADRRRDEHEPAPLTAYGRSKLAGEVEAATLRERGIEVVIVRAPAVFGPGDRALLSYFRLVKRGFAPAPAGGSERLQVIFAPDLALALARAADAPEGSWAVADPVEHSWAALADTIATALGRRPVRVTLPAPLVRLAAGVTETAGRVAGKVVRFNREKAEEMLARAWVCDLSGAEALLPHGAATPLADAVGRTVAWYKRQGWL